MKFRATYEVEGTTSHSVKFRHRQIGHVPIRTSPAPYFYAKKVQWEAWDYPEVIEIVVATTPEELPKSKPHFVYVLSNHETKAYIRYSHQQEEGIPLRQSPVPYYYIKKYRYRELGEPDTLYVLVTPRLPEVED